MSKECITREKIDDFEKYLILEEKSPATIEKYLRDVRAFFKFLEERELTKEEVIAYKKQLSDRNYAPRSINSMLASISSFLEFCGRNDCKVKQLKSQRKAYCTAEKELTKAEYMQLLSAARRDPRMYLLIQTICATGIRVSELQYFTVEAARKGEASVRCKNKTRSILIPGKLRRLLLEYAGKHEIKSGVIFCTSSGRPMDRSNIWKSMKNLCTQAKINPDKVFPHNLRKLFARTFYSIEKDIAKLADILGHSSIETTRIYIMTTGAEHRRRMDKLGLLA